MRQFSAEAKHAILLEYSRYSRTNGFAALARRHSVPGGENTVAAWYSRWDRTSQSLKRASGSGRSRYLTTAEVNRNVRPRIAAANRNNRAINYSQMLLAIQQVTGKQVSLRTLRRYGKEIGASFKRARGKTNRERQRVNMHEATNHRIGTDC
jgi:transposase